jgi:PAS domain S-box-containing protein
MAVSNKPQIRGGRGSIKLVDLLDFAIEQTNDGIAIMRLTGDAATPIRIVYANAAIERLSGFTGDELLDPSNPFFRSQPQNRERYDALLSEIRAGRSVRFEIELTGKDRTTWAEIRWSPLRYKNGAVTHYVAVLRDISELRRLSLIQSILLEISDFIVMADAAPPSAGGPFITYANPAFTRLTGLARDEIDGTAFTSYLSQNNDARTTTSILDRLERHNGIAHEVQIRHRDGDDRWVELTGHPARTEGGRVASWFFIGKDISVRKQSYLQTAQLTTALDLADEPIAIYAVLAPGELEPQHMNERAAELEQPLVEKLLADAAGRERILSLWPIVESGNSATRLVHVPDDARKWVMLELRPMTIDRGSLASIIAIEHAVRFPAGGQTPDGIATALTLAAEILRYPDLETRREALLEVLRAEWGAHATFSGTNRNADVVLRAQERGGYAVIPRGVLFDRYVAVHISWPQPLPAHRLTALRVLLEALTRTHDVVAREA